MVSTISSAWMACRIDRLAHLIDERMQPVESRCGPRTTALISCDLSSRSRASIFAGSAPLRQSEAMNSGCKPIFVAIVFHSDAK